jgi:hypothetical protein
MTTPLPTPNVVIPAAPRSAPNLANDEDAYYQPGGRIRTLADATLEAYRPEPTLLVRLRARRTTLSWVVLLLLAPLALLAIFAVALTLGQASAPAQPPVTNAASMPVKAAPAAVTTSAAAPTTASPVAPAVTSQIPVLDVNNLKSAPAGKARH